MQWTEDRYWDGKGGMGLRYGKDWIGNCISSLCIVIILTPVCFSSSSSSSSSSVLSNFSFLTINHYLQVVTKKKKKLVEVKPTEKTKFL